MCSASALDRIHIWSGAGRPGDVRWRTVREGTRGAKGREQHKAARAMQVIAPYERRGGMEGRSSPAALPSVSQVCPPTIYLTLQTPTNGICNIDLTRKRSDTDLLLAPIQPCTHKTSRHIDDFVHRLTDDGQGGMHNVAKVKIVKAGKSHINSRSHSLHVNSLERSECKVIIAREQGGNLT